MEPLKLLILDKDPLTNSALEVLLGDDERIEVVGNALKEEEAFRSLEERDVDVVLMDINVNNKTYDRPLQRLKKQFPRKKVLALLYEEGEVVDGVLRSGADGYFLKDRDMGDLADAVLRVHREGFYIPVSLYPETPSPEGVLSYQRSRAEDGEES